MLYPCCIIWTHLQGRQQEDRLLTCCLLWQQWKKISSPFLKWSSHSGLGIFSLRDERSVIEFMFSIWPSGQHVITFKVTGLSSTVTRLINIFFNRLSFKINAWNGCDELSTGIHTSKLMKLFIQLCQGSLCQRASTSLTGKNVIWWNYLRQLIFSGSNFWISF